MKIEKKLIAYSAIALMVGVASIVPLIFLMSAKAETTPKPWFNLDVPYAYMKANFTENLDGRDIYSQWQSIVLNFTLNPETENEISDARFEYYELQLYSDKEQIGNFTYFVGTNRTNSFTFDTESFPFHFMRDNWFDSNTTSGGMFTYNWNASSPPDISSGVSSYSGPTGHPTGNNQAPRMVAAFREAEILFIDVRRISFVTFNGNSTVVTLTDHEIFQHLELTKLGDGFLYNTLFPEDQLPQIDLLHPLRSLSQQKP